MIFTMGFQRMSSCTNEREYHKQSLGMCYHARFLPDPWISPKSQNLLFQHPEAFSPYTNQKIQPLKRKHDILDEIKLSAKVLPAITTLHCWGFLMAFGNEMNAMNKSKAKMRKKIRAGQLARPNLKMRARQMMRNGDLKTCRNAASNLESMFRIVTEMWHSVRTQLCLNTLDYVTSKVQFNAGKFKH